MCRGYSVFPINHWTTRNRQMMKTACLALVFVVSTILEVNTQKLIRSSSSRLPVARPVSSNYNRGSSYRWNYNTRPSNPYGWSSQRQNFGKTPYNRGQIGNPTYRSLGGSRSLPSLSAVGLKRLRPLPSLLGVRSNPSRPLPVLPGIGSNPSRPLPSTPGVGSNPSRPLPSLPGFRSNPSRPLPILPGIGSNPSRPLPSLPGIASNPSRPLPSIPGVGSNPSRPLPELPRVGSNPSRHLPSLTGVGSNPSRPLLSLPGIGSNPSRPLPSIPGVGSNPSRPLPAVLSGVGSNPSRPLPSLPGIGSNPSRPLPSLPGILGSNPSRPLPSIPGVGSNPSRPIPSLPGIGSNPSLSHPLPSIPGVGSNHPSLRPLGPRPMPSSSILESSAGPTFSKPQLPKPSAPTSSSNNKWPTSLTSDHMPSSRPLGPRPMPSSSILESSSGPTFSKPQLPEPSALTSSSQQKPAKLTSSTNNKLPTLPNSDHSETLRPPKRPRLDEVDPMPSTSPVLPSKPNPSSSNTKPTKLTTLTPASQQKPTELTSSSNSKLSTSAATANQPSSVHPNQAAVSNDVTPVGQSAIHQPVGQHPGQTAAMHPPGQAVAMQPHVPQQHPSSGLNDYDGYGAYGHSSHSLSSHGLNYMNPLMNPNMMSMMNPMMNSGFNPMTSGTLGYPGTMGTGQHYGHTYTDYGNYDNMHTGGSGGLGKKHGKHSRPQYDNYDFPDYSSVPVNSKSHSSTGSSLTNPNGKPSITPPSPMYPDYGDVSNQWNNGFGQTGSGLGSTTNHGSSHTAQSGKITTRKSNHGKNPVDPSISLYPDYSNLTTPNTNKSGSSFSLFTSPGASLQGQNGKNKKPQDMQYLDYAYNDNPSADMEHEKPTGSQGTGSRAVLQNPVSTIGHKPITPKPQNFASTSKSQQSRKPAENDYADAYPDYGAMWDPGVGNGQSLGSPGLLGNAHSQTQNARQSAPRGALHGNFNGGSQDMDYPDVSPSNQRMNGNNPTRGAAMGQAPSLAGHGSQGNLRTADQRQRFPNAGNTNDMNGFPHTGNNMDPMFAQNGQSGTSMYGMTQDMGPQQSGFGFSDFVNTDTAGAMAHTVANLPFDSIFSSKKEHQPEEKPIENQPKPTAVKITNPPIQTYPTPTQSNPTTVPNYIPNNDQEENGSLS